MITFCMDKYEIFVVVLCILLSFIYLLRYRTNEIWTKETKRDISKIYAGKAAIWNIF